MMNHPPPAAPHRRTFSCCGGGGRRPQQQQQHRFQFRSNTLFDAALDGITWSVEKLVLFLGPLLICFATAIITGLSWTFFTILLPMMIRKHSSSSTTATTDEETTSTTTTTTTTSHVWIVVGMHIGMVLFLLMEICFNYYMCVRTSNCHDPVRNPSYAQVVRELAMATHFDYPETPEQVDSFRRDFEMRLSIRVQRRHQKAQQLQQQQQQHQQPQQQDDRLRLNETLPTESEGGDAVIKNRKGGSSRPASPISTATHTIPSAQQVRDWMVMAPDEWGYCSKSRQPKPPRAHYDHVSKSLVLCLDHYCPWMFNASKS